MRRLNVGGPFVENEQVHGGEPINTIDGNGEEERKPEVAVRKRRKTGGRFEVIERLQHGVSSCSLEDPVSLMLTM